MIFNVRRSNTDSEVACDKIIAKFYYELDVQTEQRKTFCKLVFEFDSLNNPKNPIIGIATCNTKDRFSRKKGRKLALRDALKNSGKDKRYRKEVWSDYFFIVKDLKHIK